MRRLRPLAYWAALALVTAGALAALPPLRGAPLRVPITYERDGLFLAVLTKAIHEDGFAHASRVGAPFGTDLVDWPLGMWLPFAQLSALTRLLGEPGAALNLYWLSTIVVAALCAAYAYRRLSLRPGTAFVLGILYALQPYAFYRNVEHVNLAFPFVPLLALLCLRVAGVGAAGAKSAASSAALGSATEGRAERTLTLAACAAQGLSYVYYSAFACTLLAFAAVGGWCKTRSLRPPLRALAAIAILSATTAATIAPSLSYWRAHGYNPDLDYKPPAETDTYGLKLRHLLVPIAEHPLPPWRALAAKVEAVDFPGDNENVLSKLGTCGSIGLLALLGLLLARTAGSARPLDERLAASAALALATLLVANVGGLASLFSVFVSPDVRAWARIVVFLSFFCLLAFGVLLESAAGRAAARLRLRPARAHALAAPALAALLAGGVLDQAPLERLAALRDGTAEAFAEERGLVQTVEARLPRGAMVFQLPHMTVPVDRATYPPMLYYDPGRMYLHSRNLRWSWGAMIGRDHDWGRAVDALPVAEKLRVLALAGFSGVWVDRWGYTGVKRPPFEAVEREIAEATGVAALVSARGRYAFFSLEPYRRRLEAELGSERLAHERRVALADMPIARWTGCDDERRDGDGWSRSCRDGAALELRNWRPGAIRVELRLRLRAAGALAAEPTPGAAPEQAPAVLVSGPGFSDRVELHPREAAAYARSFEMDGTDNRPPVLKQPRLETVTFRLEPAGRCTGGGCLAIGDAAIETRREIAGVPVNADGGVAVRTKY